MSERHEAVPKHPLTDRPAKFSDIPERVHRDAYWLAIQKRAAAEAERDAYKALILEALDYPAAGTPAGWGRRARSVLAGVVSTREKDK